MWWPFGKPKVGLDDAAWVARAHDLARKVVKVQAATAPQIGKTLFPSGNIDDRVQHAVRLEVIAFCMHLCEREARSRFNGKVPPTLGRLLVDRTAQVLLQGVSDELTGEKLRSELAELYTNRHSHYSGYARLRAARGDSEHGTLVDGFGKLMTSTYAGKNALARAMLSATAMELVKTMPKFMDEVGLVAA